VAELGNSLANASA